MTTSLTSLQLSTGLPPTGGIGVIRKHQVFISAIHIVSQSGAINRESTIKFSMGEKAIKKIFPKEQSDNIRWNLDPPRHVSTEATLKVIWRHRRRVWWHDFANVTVPFQDMLGAVVNGKTVLQLVDRDTRIKVIFKQDDIPLPRRLEDGALTASKKSVLDRLDKARDVLQVVLRIGDALKDLHPAVNGVVTSVTLVYELLQKEDQLKKDVLDLIDNMSQIVHYIQDVDQFATVVQLKKVIERAEALMYDTIYLVVQYDAQSKLKKLRSVLLVDDQGKVADVKSRFSRLKEHFDRGMQVQSLMDGVKLKAGLEWLATSYEDDKVLRRLDPIHEPPILRCMDGTREDVLAEVFKWKGDLEDSNVLWIQGYPGTGKSTIASTLADKIQTSSSGSLGVIFGFDRQNATKTTPSALWRYVSYKLANEYPEARKMIVSKLKDGHEISLDNATADNIFRHLVAEPLRSCTDILPSRLPVIVIDAIDECGGVDGSRSPQRDTLLTTVAEWSTLPNRFKLVVTSRFERDIAKFLTPIGPKCVPLAVGSRSASSKDVRVYLAHNLKVIGQEYELPPAWPGSSALDALAERASGVFIWATTVVRYIQQGLPEMRLQQLRDSPSLPASDGIHSLYTVILNTAFPHIDDVTARYFRALAGAVVLAQTPLTKSDLEHLLGVGVNIRAVVVKFSLGLQPVLDPGDVLKFSHQSFVDFLLDGDQTVCPKPFHIDRASAHRHLVLALFRNMHSGLHFNICNLDSSYPDDNDLPVSPTAQIPGAIAYACKFWAHHLECAFPSPANTDTPLSSHPFPDQKELYLEIKHFMREKLLFWFEVMSLLGVLSTAIPMLASLQDQMSTIFIDSSPQASETDELRALINDAIRFVRYFGRAISQSTPHIYISALPFSPKSSILAQLYLPQFQGILSLKRGQLSSWPVRGVAPIAGLHKDEPVASVAPDSGEQAVSRSIGTWDDTGSEYRYVKWHTWSITSVAFSPDGKYVVSASGDKTIQMRDATTGEMVLGPLEGHSWLVSSIAFSPDGTRVVSGSWDRTIRIWDTATGETVLGPLKGHSDWVIVVAFSPDGNRVISGSFDKTIRSWDVRTGRATVVGPLDTHKGLVSSIAFSSDSKRIAAGLSNKTIQIWDARTGVTVAGPLVGHSASVTSVAFSPGGGQVVSGSDDATVRIWNTSTGKVVLGPLKGHRSMVTSVAFSPDGERVFSASWDRSIRIWDAATGEAVGGPLEGHEWPLTSLAFSPDGMHVASSSWEGTVRIWDMTGLPDSIHSARDTFNNQSFIDRDGWMLSSNKKRLFWVPRIHGIGLHRPNTVAVIGAHETVLDLAKFVHGQEWTSCYTPPAA